jgi:regulator of replication initiation timing
MALTKQQIEERLLELRNLRKLYDAAKVRVVILQTENQELRARVKELETENRVLRGEVTDIKYQLAEMKAIIFKKTKRAKEILDSDDEEDDTPKPPRPSSSYHRPIPKPEEVTNTIHHRFPRDEKGNLRLRTYYVEDIPLGINKIVTKHVVEQRYDQTKKVWVSADPLPCTKVSLGDNVQVLVATLITVERLSYEQVRIILNTLFHLTISDGEIAKILQREASKLVVTEAAMLASIQQETSHHLDESRYDLKGEPRYVWGMVGGESGDIVYKVGVSRGKGIAQALRGDSSGVLVSDDYGAYRTLAKDHQLCFAHLIRKFRDLATHPDFTPDQLIKIQSTYLEIKAFFQATKTACRDPDPETYRPLLTKQLATIAVIDPTDPKPVVRLKTTLKKNINQYLTCLSFPTIALTNNLAERAMRHVVLKRKNSFGAQSERGAKALGTLLSVLLSLHRRDPLTYFERYLELRRV